MSFYSLFGQDRVISAEVTIPYYGTWTADIIFNVSTGVPTTGTLTIGDLQLFGFVQRAFDFAGSRSMRIVGGFGGWQKTIAAKSYVLATGIPLAMVLGDAAAEVGEKIAVPTAQNVSVGQTFVRQSGPAQRVLRQLAGSLWWVDGKGTTQLAARSSAPVASQFEVISWSGGKGRFDIATENISDWMPGRSFSGPTVPTPHTIGSTSLSVTNEGTLRLRVLITP